MKITEPIYTHAQLAKLLGVHPRTLSKWYKQGRIERYRLGSSVFYGESHIGSFLYFHALWFDVEQFALIPMSEGDIDAPLSCMRSGHSPFSLQDLLNCDSKHWLTYKQFCSYASMCARYGPIDASILNNEYKLIWYGVRRKLLFALAQKNPSPYGCLAVKRSATCATNNHRRRAYD